MSTVKLDFDNASFRTVRYWAFRACRWFKLKGFLILKSSDRSYHVVFNRSVSWTENLHIVAWVALESHNKGLQRYLMMQCIKESSTLRLGCKGIKGYPKIAFRWGRKDEEIANYLRYRKLIHNTLVQTSSKAIVHEHDERAFISRLRSERFFSHSVNSCSCQLLLSKNHFCAGSGDLSHCSSSEFIVAIFPKRRIKNR